MIFTGLPAVLPSVFILKNRASQFSFVINGAQVHPVVEVVCGCVTLYISLLCPRQQCLSGLGTCSFWAFADSLCTGLCSLLEESGSFLPGSSSLVSCYISLYPTVLTVYGLDGLTSCHCVHGPFMVMPPLLI